MKTSVGITLPSTNRYALQREGERRQGFALVTSRCSPELIHKALREWHPGRGLSAPPTSLSAQWARPATTST
jgi:FdhD protein